MERSPTTHYRDYAISRSLIHWESQSITRADSATGQRCRNHERDGRTVLLFTCERADERAFWFLGPARYVSHTGEKPMGITWKLDVDLPGDLYAAFAAAVAWSASLLRDGREAAATRSFGVSEGREAHYHHE